MNIREFKLFNFDDDFAIILNSALKEDKDIYIPRGTYIVKSTIYLPSDVTITADKDAYIKCANHCFDRKGDTPFVMNDDKVNGNKNIKISGGIWDCNSIYNDKIHYKEGPATGLGFCLDKVDNLVIENLTIKNSNTYNFRLCEVTNFVMHDITFAGEYQTICQDGIHIGGGSKHGHIYNIKCEGINTNDDLIAINADEAMEYCQNIGYKEGNISDILVENVSAENCWSVIRVLSIRYKIENITFRNFKCGFREIGLNLDGTRYAGDKLFKDEDYPEGIGKLNNILFEDFTLWHVRNFRPVCVLETNAHNLVIKNFKRDVSKEGDNDLKTIVVKHLGKGTILTTPKGKVELDMSKTFECNCSEISEFRIN
jgi:polygalacturonase